MADPYKRLKRQIERKRRRERFHEDQLLDIGYRGYTLDRKRLDAQLGFQLDWLGKQK